MTCGPPCDKYHKTFVVRLQAFINGTRRPRQGYGLNHPMLRRYGEVPRSSKLVSSSQSLSPTGCRAQPSICLHSRRPIRLLVSMNHGHQRFDPNACLHIVRLQKEQVEDFYKVYESHAVLILQETRHYSRHIATKAHGSLATNCLRYSLSEPYRYQNWIYLGSSGI